MRLTSPLFSAFYLTVSVGLSVWNKFILVRHNWPLLLLSCQFLLLFLASGVLIATLLRSRLRDSPFWVSKVSCTTFFTSLCPVGAFYGLDVVLTTVAISTGPIALVEMVKSLFPTFILIANLAQGRTHHLTRAKSLAVLILTAGQFLVFANDASASAECILASIGALLAAAVKLVMIEHMLHGWAAGAGSDANTSGESVQLAVAAESSRDPGDVELMQPQSSDHLHDAAKEPVFDFEQSSDERLEDEDGDDSEARAWEVMIRGHSPTPSENPSIASSESLDDLVVSQKERMHSILALFYFMPCAWAIAFTGFLVLEARKVDQDVLERPKKGGALAGEYALSALLAFAINWSELFLVGEWSALAFGVLGGVKLLVVLLCSVAIFGHEVSVKAAFGYVMVMLGVFGWNWSKVRDKARRGRGEEQAERGGEEEEEDEMRRGNKSLAMRYAARWRDWVVRVFCEVRRRRRGFEKVFGDMPVEERL